MLHRQGSLRSHIQDVPLCHGISDTLRSDRWLLRQDILGGAQVIDTSDTCRVYK